MKRLPGWVICLGLATIYAATLPLGAEEATGITDEKAPYTYKFSKREFNGAARISFTLDVKPNRPDLVITAVCLLQDEQQNIGRFPLGNINADVADAPVRFRINCLADAYSKKSTIQVEFREKKTKKHVHALEISLRDAVPEVVDTSVKED